MNEKQFRLLTHYPFLFAIFIDGVTISLIFPLLHTLIIDNKTQLLSISTLNEREFIYSIVIFFYMLSWAWGNALISSLSDKMGRKPALLISMSGRVLGFLLTLIAIKLFSLSFLILVRLIEGITNGIQPDAEAVGVDISPNKALRPTFIGYLLLPVALGDLFGALIDRYLQTLTFFGELILRPVYFGLIISSIALLLIFFSGKETHQPKNPDRIQFFYPIQIFIDLFRMPKLYLLSLIFLIAVMGWACFYSYLSIFAKEYYGFTTRQVILLMATTGVGFALGWGFMVRIFHHFFAPKHVFTMNAFLTGLCILLILLIHQQPLFWILVFLAALFMVIAYTTLLGLFSITVADDSQGWIMGIAGAIHFFTFGMAGLLAFSLLKISIAAVFIVAIALLLSSCVLILFTA